MSPSSEKLLGAQKHGAHRMGQNVPRKKSTQAHQTSHSSPNCVFDPPNEQPRGLRLKKKTNLKNINWNKPKKHNLRLPTKRNFAASFSPRNPPFVVGFLDGIFQEGNDAGLLWDRGRAPLQIAFVWFRWVSSVSLGFLCFRWVLFVWLVLWALRLVSFVVFPSMGGSGLDLLLCDKKNCSILTCRESKFVIYIWFFLLCLWSFCSRCIELDLISCGSHEPSNKPKQHIFLTIPLHHNSIETAIHLPNDQNRFHLPKWDTSVMPPWMSSVKSLKSKVSAKNFTSDRAPLVVWEKSWVC